MKRTKKLPSRKAKTLRRGHRSCGVPGGDPGPVPALPHPWPGHPGLRGRAGMGEDPGAGRNPGPLPPGYPLCQPGWADDNGLSALPAPLPFVGPAGGRLSYVPPTPPLRPIPPRPHRHPLSAGGGEGGFPPPLRQVDLAEAAAVRVYDKREEALSDLSLEAPPLHRGGRPADGLYHPPPPRPGDRLPPLLARDSGPNRPHTLRRPPVLHCARFFHRPHDS